MSSPVLGGRWEDQQLNFVATGTGGTPATKTVYRGELELFTFTAGGIDQIGGISKMLSTLNSRAQQIEGQQSGLQGLASAQQAASSSNSATGIASYMRMFSL